MAYISFDEYLYGAVPPIGEMVDKILTAWKILLMQRREDHGQQSKIVGKNELILYFVARCSGGPKEGGGPLHLSTWLCNRRTILLRAR